MFFRWIPVERIVFCANMIENEATCVISKVRNPLPWHISRRLKPCRNSRCRRALCVRNALWDREDCLSPVPHRGIPAISSREAEAHILLTCVVPSLHTTLAHKTGTMSEIEKALAELKALMKYRAEQLGRVEEFRGMGLTSRKNLCLHPQVKREKSGTVVDAKCRSLTAGFVKEKKERGEDVPVCIYHDVGHVSLL